MPKLIVRTLILSAALTTAALAQDPEASQAQDLTNCAGAVAAAANFDVLIFPREARGEWAPVLARILDRLNTEPGVEGMTGRYAASAARSYWAEQPREARDAQANQCRQRYGS